MSTYKLLLKQIRKSRGLTQREAADLAGVSISTYRTWEQGTSGMSLENACRVAMALDCSPNELCGWYETHPQDRGKARESGIGELEECYAHCTPERKAFLVQSARDAALASGDAAGGAARVGVAS